MSNVVSADGLLVRSRATSTYAWLLAGAAMILLTCPAAAESLSDALEHAEVASRFKTSLLRLVSHELRTPLGALQLQLERLSGEHRIVYLVRDDRIDFLQARYHY